MVMNRLVLLVDGSGTVVASETTMFYQDELGGGLHRVGPFSPFCNDLVGKKIGSWAE
jgi:hypothetical protein